MALEDDTTRTDQTTDQTATDDQAHQDTSQADQSHQADTTQADQSQDQRWYSDDWRQQLAGGDEKLAKRLERFTDPAGLLKSWRAAEQKISSGEFKRATPPENASEDEVKQWRYENGIPDAPEGYSDIKIDEKLYNEEEDKPYLESFYKYAHEQSIPKPYVEKFLGYLFNNRKDQFDKIAEGDAEDKTSAEESLRAEWGGDYKINMNLMSGLFDGVSPELKESIFDARLSDGTKLVNNPDVVKFFVTQAREINPAATVVPNSGGANAAKSIDEEIADIQKFMQSNREEYFKDNAKQERYRELLQAREKLQKKAG